MRLCCATMFGCKAKAAVASCVYCTVCRQCSANMCWLTLGARLMSVHCLLPWWFICFQTLTIPGCLHESLQCFPCNAAQRSHTQLQLHVASQLSQKGMEPGDICSIGCTKIRVAVIHCRRQPCNMVRGGMWAHVVVAWGWWGCMAGWQGGKVGWQILDLWQYGS